MKAIIIVFCFLSSYTLLGQELIYSNINTEKGLPSSETYQILQDSKGFIWVATGNGLAKFNGKTFKIFTTDDGLPSNTILSLKEDPHGSIWLTTLSNNIVQIVDDRVVNKEFVYIKDNQAKQDLNKSSFDINFTDSGKLCLMNKKNGCYYLENLGDTLVYQGVIYNTLPNAHLTGCFYHFAQNKDRAFRAIVQQCHTNTPRTSQQGASKIKLHIDLSQANISSGKDSKLKLYYLSSGDLFCIDQLGNFAKFRGDSLYQNGHINVQGVKNVYEDRKGNVWILTTTGICFFRHGVLSSEFIRFFDEQFITDMVQDNEGNYWFTDHHNGLYKVPSVNFLRYILSKTSKAEKIVSFSHKGDQLFFATINGEVWQVGRNKEFSNIYNDDREQYDYYPITALSNKKLFLPSSFLVGNHRSDIAPNFLYRIFKTVAQKQDTIYVGTSDGIVSFDCDGKCIYTSSRPLSSLYNAELEEQRYEKRTNAIYVDGHNLWLGSEFGLYLKDRGTYSYLGNNHRLLKSRVLSIFPFDENVIMLGTKGNGVLGFQKSTNKVLQLSIRQGLLSNIVNVVYVKDKVVYAGTNKGLSVISKDSSGQYSVKNFNVVNGLPSNEIHAITSFNGEIWLGTSKGIVTFNQDDLEPNSSPPPIYVTSVTCNDTVFQIQESVLKLSTTQREINIAYDGIGFRSGSNINYRFFMEGLDTDTLYTTNQTARYTNIPPGEYIFNVWAQNEDGYWSSSPSKLSLQFERKFVETHYFMGLMVLLSLGLIGLISLLISRWYRKQLRFRLQTANLKQQALAALMNPHFIFNTLSAIQHFMLTGDDKNSHHYLSRFSKLIRQNLNAVKEGQILLEDEIDRLKLYLELEQMRFGKKMDFEVHINNPDKIVGIEIPSMIIQPFVENSIWHGLLPMEANGKIEVRFLVLETRLNVFVIDNGVGIDHSVKQKETLHHTSVSMKITQERLDILEKQTGRKHSVTIMDRATSNEVGTKVQITIPIDKMT